jgi:class 3 adenylate cyclase
VPKFMGDGAVAVFGYAAGQTGPAGYRARSASSGWRALRLAQFALWISRVAEFNVGVGVR